MTSEKSNTTPRHSHLSPDSATPLQPIPLNMALETHGNDTALTPPVTLQSASTSHEPLSPADCRTLKMLLTDVRTPSPLASSSVGEQDGSLLSIGDDTAGDDDSDAGNEDQVQYTELQYAVGDKRQGGYQDEDDSMQLSDTTEGAAQYIPGDERDEGYADEDESMDFSDVAGEETDDYDVRSASTTDVEQRKLSDASNGGHVWSDGDTIEDIMNIPGKTASLGRELDLGGVYRHDQSTPEHVWEIKAQRAEIEKEVEAERLDQERRDAAVIEKEAFGPDAISDEETDDAVHLSDDTEFRAIEAVQAEIGMTLIEHEEDTVVELEVCIQYPPDNPILTLPVLLPPRPPHIPPLLPQTQTHLPAHDPAPHDRIHALPRY
jgi:hypothetical protein